MSDDIPRWAFERARQLTDSESEAHASRGVPLDPVAVVSVQHEAFARYIAEREEPPLDPLLLKAREICSNVMEAHTGVYCREQAEAYRDGRHDDEPDLAFVLETLRGIELGRASK